MKSEQFVDLSHQGVQTSTVNMDLLDCNTANPTNAATANPAGQMPFRFMHLPPELRNRVYQYASITEKNVKHNIATLSEPSLAAVSKQVRDEFLPVFFAEAEFYCIVASNLQSRWIARTSEPRTPSTRAIDKRWSTAAGTMAIKRAVSKFIRASNDAVIFRKVSLMICDARFVNVYRRRGEDRAPWLKAHQITFNVSGSSLSIRDVPGPWHPSVNPHRPLVCEEIDIEAMSASVRAIAQQASHRQGFLGFTIGDLRKIVKGLRFQI